MNFLLLRQDEVGAGGECTLRGRRADHVRSVLRAEVGQTLRAGLLDGPLATAVVRAIDEDRVEVLVTTHALPAPTADVLLLAVPRPKVLLRLYAIAASLGFARLVLFRSWRVEKSHLQSRALDSEVQHQHLLHGLEQAGRTQVPRVSFHPLFRPFVEDVLETLDLPARRFVAHPAAEVDTRQLAPLGSGPIALTIGPEGGFLPYEVDQLAARGFLPICCGPAPLRTETALAVLTGQLALLRQCLRLAP